MNRATSRSGRTHVGPASSRFLVKTTQWKGDSWLLRRPGCGLSAWSPQTRCSCERRWMFQIRASSLFR
ncbi:hypothetical protein D3C85_788740 [compost metagenome]